MAAVRRNLGALRQSLTLTEPLPSPVTRCIRSLLPLSSPSLWPALTFAVLCVATQTVHADPSSPRRALHEAAFDDSILLVVIACLVGLILVAVVVWMGWTVHRRCKSGGASSKGGSTSPKKGDSMHNAITVMGTPSPNGAKYVSSPVEETMVPAVPLNDVQVATEGFSDSLVLHDTGYSTVLKGEGPNGEQWAVKRAKRVSLEGSHLFRNEIDFLSQICHENIVTLLAACDDNHEQILVFEFMPNGPLSAWLRPFPDDSRPPLSYDQRLDVALGVAEALRYLHSFAKPTIIHRDVKSDTILLDEQFKVKVGGLGLLKHLPGEALRMRMTRRKGYLDPEYFQTFKVTTKCDVYSFGVVMLELLTAYAPIVQPPIAPDGVQPPPMTLPQYCLPYVQEGSIDKIIDPRMPLPELIDNVYAFAHIAAACVAPSRKDRPDMARVAFLLAELKQPAEVRSPAFQQFQVSGRVVSP